MAKPASCESQRVCVTYRDKHGVKYTKEVVRSYTLKPIEVQGHQNKDGDDEQIQEVYSMRINKNGKILNKETTKEKRIFQEDQTN